MKKVCLTLLSLWAATAIFAQQERTISKKMGTADIQTVNITNSFGNIHVTPYSGEIIDILVTIHSDANSKESRSFIDNVRVDVQKSGSTVNLSTENLKLNSGFWRGVKSFRIDYSIKMPEAINLIIDNSFGDVKIDGISGKLSLKVQHGNVFIGKATAAGNSMDIQFGDIRIETINQLNLVCQHGDIRIGSARDLEMKVQFGDSKIDELSGHCRINSNHGDITIQKLAGDLRDLDFDIMFSDLDIGNLGSRSYVIKINGSFLDYSWDDAWNVRAKNSAMENHTFIIENRPKTEADGNINIEASHSGIALK